MFTKLKSSKGDSILEYSIILGIVILMFTGMNTYVKRGFQNRIKDMTDYFIGSRQVGEINPTAVSNSTTNTTATSNVSLSDEIGGGKAVESQEVTNITASSEVVDDGDFNH